MGRVTVMNDLASSPPDARLEKFGQALAEALRKSNRTQIDVAAFLGVGQGTVSEWKTGKAQPHDHELTFTMEKFLGTDPGELSKHLGYLPPEAAGPSWQEALARDPRIDSRLREVIIAVVEAMTKE